jgi:protein required for attachment to host cells
MFMSTWLVLAHATDARIYDITRKDLTPKEMWVKTFTHAEGRLKNHELVTDKPGTYSQGFSEGGASQFAKDHSPHEMELNYFAEQLAHYLEHERTEHHYDKLVIVMDPHFYGIFEQHASAQVQKLVLKYVHKNYLAQPEADLNKAVLQLCHDFV